MDLQTALLVDIVVLLSSVWLVLAISDRSVFNPTLWYVALHSYTVTFRLVTLNLGAKSIAAIGIRSDLEFVNAALAADIALLAAVAATVLTSRWASAKDGVHSLDRKHLSLNLGQVISFSCLIIGTAALLKFGTAAKDLGSDTSTLGIGRFEDSSYPIWIAGFAVQGALIQCAMKGFTRWRTILLLALLFLSSFNARTVLVLGSAMAFLIHQTRHNQRTLPLKAAISILIFGLLWFVYKPVAGAIMTGSDPMQIWLTAQDYVEKSVDNDSSIDTQFLDMQASYMAASDEAGRRFYGATILPLLYLPIPRFTWPEKPRINEFAPELSSSSRTFVQQGMTPNLAGESYMNFGWIGCAVIPFLYLTGMQVAYWRTRACGIDSPGRWIYLIYLISMVQVFRDGLNSLILYPLMVYLPLLSWGLLGILLPTQSSGARRPLATGSLAQSNWAD